MVTKQEIQKTIDRLVGTKGNLNIPSWWMRKILSDLVKYCEDNELTSAIIKEYNKSQFNLVADKIEKLDTKLNNIGPHKLFEIVNELPVKPKDNIIYLVPSLKGEGNNVLTEWAWVNGSWEQFGEFGADVNLNDYATKEDLKSYATKDYVDGQVGQGTGNTSIKVDSALSADSSNPVQNKVITEVLSSKLESEKVSEMGPTEDVPIQGGGGDDTMTRILAGATPFICYRKTDGKIGFWNGYFEDLNHRYQTDIVEILFGGLGATPKTAQFLNGWTNLERIYPFMNGSGCTNLAFAFTNDAKLKDLSMLMYWDVSQVTIANECFRDTAPDILPIEDWDISNMTNMAAMFQRYTGVDVDFSKWTNNKVTSLGSFFRDSSIKKVDLHNINTENCTALDGFARGAKYLEWLDIRGWSCISAQATNAMHAMFNGCRQLTTLVGDTSVEEVISQDIKVLDGYTATSNLSIKESSVPLNRASLRALINGLADMTETGATLPIGSANIAKLTSDDIAVATAKGWTIS